jgi:hypothetical protein
VIFLPTAYTHPAGTVYVSDYEIAIVQAGYALSDSTQLTLTSTIPIEGIVVADLSVKTVVAREGPVRVAAIGSVSGFLSNLDIGSATVGRVGAVTEMCFDDPCRSSVSLGGTAVLVGGETAVGAGLGFIWRAVKWLGLLAEVDTLTPTTMQAGNLNGIALSAGVRLPHRDWSLDLALVRPLGLHNAPTVPFAAFTLRFLP